METGDCRLSTGDCRLENEDLYLRSVEQISSIEGFE